MWLELARDVEAAGFQALYAAGHPGSTPSPFVTLAAAAAVTERIQLGTCVVNAGVWEPLALASEAATLEVVSGGRAVLGLGRDTLRTSGPPPGGSSQTASDRAAG